MTQAPILGVVLAGGQSRRFGSDKANALLGKRTLIEHAIDSLMPYTDMIAVCGRPHPGVTTLADRPGPDMGPLGGLNAALHFADERGFAGVLTLGCDMPMFPADLARHLIGSDAAIVHGQHLVGYWPSSLAGALDDHLAENADRSILKWLERVRPRSIIAEGRPLPNINTPADLTALEAQWPPS